MSKKLTIEDAHIVAREKGGKCLSTEYHRNLAKLQWECDKGHTWWASLANVKNCKGNIKKSTWCPTCASARNDDAKRKGLQVYRDIAEKRGGKCLSDTYTSVKHKLLWQCSLGHTWEAVPESVERGTWCPYCHCFLKEAIVRQIFQQLFDAPFPKSRPPWLRYKSQMELDGYNYYLQLAFEHNGKQHYQRVGCFKNNVSENKKRDKVKKDLCKIHGVTLIVVPEIRNLLKYDRLIPFLKRKLKKYPDCKWGPLDINSLELYSKPDKMIALKEVASSKGGECLSPSYLGLNTRLNFKCAVGHVWKATPYQILKMGNWCKWCANKRITNKRKPTIEQIQEYVAKKGGKCLSTKYENMKTKLLFECSKGHKWYATLNNIKFGGTWCPECYQEVICRF